MTDNYWQWYNCWQFCLLLTMTQLLTMTDNYWQWQTNVGNNRQLLTMTDNYWQWQTTVDNERQPMTKSPYCFQWQPINNIRLLLTMIDILLLTVIDNCGQRQSIIDKDSILLKMTSYLLTKISYYWQWYW
jgi:hypothetical protein